MKTKFSIIIGLLAIFVGACCCFIAFANSGFSGKKLFTSSLNLVEKEMDNLIANEIFVDSAIDSIEIHGVEREDIKIEYAETEYKKYEITIENGQLRIKGTEHNIPWYKRIINFNFYTEPIKLFVPTNMENINIHSAVGDLHMENLNVNKLTFTMNVGSVSLKNITSLQGDVKINVGNVSLENSNIQQLKVSVDVGNCDLEQITTADLNAYCNVGDVDVSLYGTKEEYLTTVKVNVGNKNISNTTSGDKKLNLKVNVGDIEVSFL